LGERADAQEQNGKPARLWYETESVRPATGQPEGIHQARLGNWTATLAESSANFKALVAPIYDWLNNSPSRVPLTDWYWTTDGKQAGFQARSVVGGVYIKMLGDPAMWKKWSSKAQ